ncbi:MAG: YdhR family protein [Alphaproteobacteria bacterium]|nr:YdhR family protein [Alphaproteobacteria bacterium]
MITEIVLFDLPKGITRAEMIAQFREAAPRWRQNPDLTRKYMIFDLERGKGGGVYLWNSVAAAKRWHDEAFRQRIRATFGSEPTYQYFDTPVIVDNAARDVIVEAAE